MGIKLLFIFLFAIFPFQISAIFWDDLRVKFGPPTAGDVNNTAFTRLPRLANDASKLGMNSISPDCDNGGKYYGYRYKWPTYDNLILLFDTNGVIAGIQALLPKDEVMKPGNPYRFNQEPMFQPEILNGKRYTVLTAYFVEPTSICKSGRSPQSIHSNGTGTGLFLQSGPNPRNPNIIVVPTLRSAAIREGYTATECLPGMGFHNFWELDKWEETSCTRAQPIQLLYNLNGGMIGFVFQVFSSSITPQFEIPPTRLIKAIIGVERTPQCIIDLNEKHGTTALHIYFIDRPWEIKCTV